MVKNKKNISEISKKRRYLNIIKVVTVALALYYSLAMPVLTGVGLIYNRSSYGKSLEMTGVFFIISGIVMLLGTIFCLFGKKTVNIFSVFFSASGYVLCMIMLYRLVRHADTSGWTDKFTLSPISDMYKIRIIPCIAPVMLSVSIAVGQLLSYDSIGYRHEKRRKKEEERNAPSPKILGDD